MKIKTKTLVRQSFFFALAILLWTCCTVVAQNPAPEQSLLWKIEGNGIKTSYVFGTFHILPKKDFELKEKVKVALNVSDQLIMELNMDDPSLQSKMMQHMGMKDGKTLDQVFSKEDYLKLDTELKEILGVGVENFNHFKPFMLNAIFLANFLGGEPASFELTLLEMAKEGEMEIGGLETVAEQLAVFDEIPYESQAKDVMKLIDEKDLSQKLFDSMIRHYKAEDLSGIAEMMDDYFASEQEYDLLLTKRNIKWVPLIKDKAQTKSTFFAVGAGHLIGDSGLIALLKKEGYQVSAVF